MLNAPSDARTDTAKTYWVRGKWYDLPMPAIVGGGFSHARYQGSVGSSDALPQDPQKGDMYYNFGDGNFWIFASVFGNAPAWVDP